MLAARFCVRCQTPRHGRGKMGRKYAKAWADTFHGCPVSLEARGLLDVMREAAAQSWTGAPVVRWEVIAMHGHPSRLRRILAELVVAELVELPEGCAVLEHETKRGPVLELCRVDDEVVPKSVRSPTSLRLAPRVSQTTQDDVALRREKGKERTRVHRTKKKEAAQSKGSYAKNAYRNVAVTPPIFILDQPLTPSAAVGSVAARPEDRGRATNHDEEPNPPEHGPCEPVTPGHGGPALGLSGEGSGKGAPGPASGRHWGDGEPVSLLAMGAADLLAALRN
jgi:hypothetical protein